MTAATRGASKQIRVIAFRDGDMWSAQCLEYDIGPQAEDLDTLYRRVVLAIGAEREESVARHGKAFASIDPAPKRFHDMWKQASGSFNPRTPQRPHDDGRVELELALCA